MRLSLAFQTSTCAFALALLVSAAAPVHAQTTGAPPAQPGAAPPATVAPPQADPAAAAPTIEEQLRAMQAKIDAQQAEIDALRASVAQSPGRGEDAELEATLAALGEETDEDVSRFESAEPISIYGYLDVGFQRLFAPQRNPIRNLVGSDEGTFLLGNVNFYFDVTPDPDWRSLTEIRFTNLPHGAESIGVRGGKPYSQIDNSALNQTSPDGRDRVLLGNIMLERAWIQWQRYPLFNVRVGQWLTPFGIWNVDHGSPVLITVTQPDFQLSESFPSRQTGIQLTGEAPVGSLELTYSAYLSNGRTKGLVDLSDDKAIGGRIVLQKPGSDSIAVGTSVYYGTYQEQEKYILRVTPDFRVERATVVDLEELVVGLDFSLDSGPFRFRTEGVVRRIDAVPEKSETPNHGQPGSFEPNHFYTAGYVIFAYRLPWLGIEPTFQFEAMHRPAAFGDTIISTTPGFNIHFAPTVQLKNSFGHVGFHDLTKGDGRSEYQYMWTLNSRLVLAF
jgi:hypothetical protein